MKITQEIRDKINPFVDVTPRPLKSLLALSSKKGLDVGHYDDDDDLPEFNDSVPISVARLAVSEFEQYEQEQNESVE